MRNIFAISTLPIYRYFQKMSVECPVCFETFQKDGEKRPKFLPCYHTYCCQCLEQMVQGGQLTCPECRANNAVPSGGVQVLTTNRYILDNLDLAERNAQLERKQQPLTPTTLPGTVQLEGQTQLLIPTAPPHQQENAYVINLHPNRNNEPGICPDHDQPFEVFCFGEQCGRMLCAICLIHRHENHDLAHITEDEVVLLVQEETRNQEEVARNDARDGGAEVETNNEGIDDTQRQRQNRYPCFTSVTTRYITFLLVIQTALCCIVVLPCTMAVFILYLVFGLTFDVLSHPCNKDGGFLDVIEERYDNCRHYVSCFFNACCGEIYKSCYNGDEDSGCEFICTALKWIVLIGVFTIGTVIAVCTSIISAIVVGVVVVALAVAGATVLIAFNIIIFTMYLTFNIPIDVLWHLCDRRHDWHECFTNSSDYISSLFDYCGQSIAECLSCCFNCTEDDSEYICVVPKCIVYSIVYPIGAVCGYSIIGACIAVVIALAVTGATVLIVFNVAIFTVYLIFGIPTDTLWYFCDNDHDWHECFTNCRDCICSFFVYCGQAIGTCFGCCFENFDEDDGEYICVVPKWIVYMIVFSVGTVCGYSIIVVCLAVALCVVIPVFLVGGSVYLICKCC